MSGRNAGKKSWGFYFLSAKMLLPYLFLSDRNVRQKYTLDLNIKLYVTRFYCFSVRMTLTLISDYLVQVGISCQVGISDREFLDFVSIKSFMSKQEVSSF